MKGLIVLTSTLFATFTNVISTNEAERQAKLLGFKIYLNQAIRVTYTSTVYPTCYATYPTQTSCTARRKRQFDLLLEEPRIPYYFSPPLRYEPMAAMERHNGIDSIWQYPSLQHDVESSFTDRPGNNLDQARSSHLDHEEERFFSPVTFSVQGWKKTTLKTSVVIATVTGPTVTFTVGCTIPSGTPTPACPSKKCSSNSDCPCATPACVNGVCIKCSSDSDCSGSKPYCITTTGLCSECVSFVQCGVVDPTKGFCSIAKGECVACFAGSGCFPPKDVCDETTGTCRACTSNTECTKYAGAGLTCQAGGCL